VVMQTGFRVPDYRSGYYVMDPVFASAVRTATRLGYRLVAYDTTERGPPDDGSFRDRRQAENLKRLVFDADPAARLFVLAGRGHAAEVPPADGWKPMASVLKQLTGIDPFTVYAPTMSQRQRREDEDPLYRFATGKGLVTKPTIFAGDAGECVGPASCDAYVFWPRFEVAGGRADWLAKTLGRQPAAIPSALLQRPGLQLVQVFLPDEPATVIPIDQILLRPGEPTPVLMLPAGQFWSRAIDAKGSVVGPVALDTR
jgi:hypothetical protein